MRLAHRGMLRWLALALLVAAPVAVIVVCVVAGLLWEIALSVVLAAVAIAAGRAALRSDGPPDKPHEHAIAPPRQPFVIMNPRSDGGKVAKFGPVRSTATCPAVASPLWPGFKDVA